MIKFDHKAWFTLYQPEFHPDEYLYHFTSIDKAVLILDGNCLKFSKITSMNDTLEAKPKMSKKIISSNENVEKIFNEIDKINKNYIQLICFTKDKAVKKCEKDQIAILTDYSGRGFALPRMWAQYAHNNDGVCFVFNKSKLLNTIHGQLGGSIISEGDIKYVSQYTSFDFNYEESLKFLINNNSKINASLNFVDFLKKNKKYTNYNYFFKLDDWFNENEFRILAYGDENLFIKPIRDSIVGIIIGEQIKPTDEKIIKFFSQGVCEIKKINFSYNGCALENIYD